MENINELMQKVNCKRLPERWCGLFLEAKEEYKRNGCPLAERDYYIQLENKHKMFGDVLEAYLMGAESVKGDEAFELFLVLVSIALKERENIRQEIAEFIAPASPKNENDIKYDMLTGLLICSQTEYAYNKMKGFGLDEETVNGALRLFAVNGVKGFMLRHQNCYGYDLLGWFQLSVEGTLYPVEQLQIQIDHKFYCDAVVFINEKGETAALSTEQTIHSSGHVLGARFCEDEKDSFLAGYVETDDAYIGNPYDENGLILREKVTLRKNEWKIALKKGDPVASVHIPKNASITKADTQKFFDAVKVFLEKNFPDYDYKAFVCGSWLMDTALKEYLKPESSIICFQNFFEKIHVKSRGEGVFKFVFNRPDPNVDFNELEEDTSLQRNIKNRYLNGAAIYEVMGYRLK